MIKHLPYKLMGLNSDPKHLSKERGMVEHASAPALMRNGDENISGLVGSGSCWSGLVREASSTFSEKSSLKTRWVPTIVIHR